MANWLVRMVLVVAFGTVPAVAVAQGPCAYGGGRLSHPAAAPAEVFALVEIPAGGQVKYELDLASGRLRVDRFLSMPVAYPINYGIVPCASAPDGDPLDVLVLTRMPVAPGALIRVRPVGVMTMRDRGQVDDKILAVPVSSVDPTYDAVRAPADLPALDLRRIEEFFRVYKRLPDPTVEVTIGEWRPASAATALLSTALKLPVR
jgi:inorganic pyrophosphatase